MSIGVDLMVGETSFVILVIAVIIDIVVVVAVGRSDVELEFGTVEVDDHKVDVDIDFDIRSIVVSSKTSVSLQKSVGFWYETGDVCSIISPKSLVRSFAVSFVTSRVDFDKIVITVSLGSIKIDQMSFAVS